MWDTDKLWMDSYGFVYSADGKRMLKGANVKGAYWIPEYDQLVFSEDEEENEELMPAVYFWTKFNSSSRKTRDGNSVMELTLFSFLRLCS